MYKNWQIAKSALDNEETSEQAQQEYSEVAQWCCDGQEYRIVEDGDYYKVEPIPAPSKEEQSQFEIAKLKQYLADTDYISNKLIEAIDDAELQDLKEKYADILRKRREARARINELEK